MNPDLFLDDLEAKPAALTALARRLDVEDPWRAVRGARQVLLFGMGSSRYAAEVAALALRRRGIAAIAEYASVERSLPDSDDTLVIAISATGTSAETVAAAEAYQPRLIALTNEPDSPLAAMAASVIGMHAGIERGGVACRTFQHSLVLLMALAAGTSGDAARAAAAATADLLDRRAEWLPRTLELLDGSHGVHAIAPAERLSSASQSALMVREGPRRPATASETGDWAHVDVYLTKTLDYRALLFPGSRYDESALDWLRQRDSTVVAVGDEVAGAAQCIRYRGDHDPLTRLLTETLVAELVAAAWWAAGSPAEGA